MSTEERVTARDGTELLVRRWPATSGPAWATVLIVHGLAEHSGRYEHVGARLAQHGADAVSYDQRGFGASGGRRAYVDDWSELDNDLADRLADARASAPGRPVAIYGHSMGGLVALGYALTPGAQPDAYVLTAPGVSSKVPGWQQAAIRAVAVVAPRRSFTNPFDGSALSRDPSVGERYVADPRVFRSTTFRFAASAFGEQGRVLAALDGLEPPTLVLHGGEDRLVPSASSEVFERLPNVTRRVVPGLRHEIHNEPEGLDVVDEIAAWLAATLAPGRSVLASSQSNIASGERVSAESVARPQTRGT
jgi:alpha-beta hydrolase superfamily lysophospholipase